MTRKKLEPVAIDQQEYDKAVSDLEYRLTLAKDVSAIWNSCEILPRMNKQHFVNLISHGTDYLEIIYKKEFLQGVDQVKKGLGQVFQSNDLIPSNYNRPRLSRILSTIKSSHGISVSRHVHHGMIDFDADGTPYVKDETLDILKESMSAYATPENQKLRDAGSELVKAANQTHEALLAVVEKTTITSSELQHTYFAAFANPKLIDNGTPQPGARSLSPVVFDRSTGKHVFNEFCLIYGSPAPKTIERVEPEPLPEVAVDTKTANPYKLTRIQSFGT